VVTLDTLRKLHEHGHQLAAYCPTCERWAVLDLPALIAAGHGHRYCIGWRPRCSYCRGRGEVQVLAPALRREIAVFTRRVQLTVDLIRQRPQARSQLVIRTVLRRNSPSGTF
jgi:hypothetical protein